MHNKYIPNIADGLKLPNIDNDEVDVFIFLPIGIERKLITELDDKLKKSARKTLKNSSITKFITYYTFEDDDDSVPPYELVIRYTKKEWYKAVEKADNPNDYPLIGYLVLKPDGWGDWHIFVDEITETLSPEEGGDEYGYIYLSIKKLVDPLIGDC